MRSFLRSVLTYDVTSIVANEKTPRPNLYARLRDDVVRMLNHV
jgi:hypothetical protein